MSECNIQCERVVNLNDVYTPPIQQVRRENNPMDAEGLTRAPMTGGELFFFGSLIALYGILSAFQEQGADWGAIVGGVISAATGAYVHYHS